VVVPGDLIQRLSIKPDHLPAVLRALGLRLLPAVALAEGAYGPPCPATLATQRRKRAEIVPVPTPPVMRHDSPFAALAALRR